MNFYDKFIELCTNAGKLPTNVAVEIGLSKSAPSNWKKRIAAPKDSTLSLLAQYFGVSVAELRGEEEIKKEPTATTGSELDDISIQIVDILSRLSPEKRAEALRYLQYLEAREDS